MKEKALPKLQIKIEDLEMEFQQETDERSIGFPLLPKREPEQHEHSCHGGWVSRACKKHVGSSDSSQNGSGRRIPEV